MLVLPWMSGNSATRPLKVDMVGQRSVPNHGEQRSRTRNLECEFGKEQQEAQAATVLVDRPHSIHTVRQFCHSCDRRRPFESTPMHFTTTTSLDGESSSGPLSRDSRPASRPTRAARRRQIPDGVAVTGTQVEHPGEVHIQTDDGGMAVWWRCLYFVVMFAPEHGTER